MMDYPPTVRRLIESLRQLPSVGPRSAERLALHILRAEPALAQTLAASISGARDAVRPCERCGFYAETPVCEICAAADRDPHTVCIVEQPTDVITFEKSGAFKGLYHVLGGSLSPLDDIGPEELHIPKLINRLRGQGAREAILALNTDVKGETTTLYLARELRQLGIKVTRLATGISIGSPLEYADSLTLTHALGDRKEV
ncbi:MAG: recombination mediator RecR [Verrucomicrobiales bacterium]|jgi:recombination protein RecR|nr:recombination mediator RecR [Verrucomicrobiales bacterium]